MKVLQIVSEEKNCWQQREIAASAVNGESSMDVLQLGERRQAIRGFGGCFNELGWEALQLLPQEVREDYIRELFSEEGCHFVLGRVPIGANDFSLEWYSCDESSEDDPELKKFNIDRDKKYTLPFVKEAMKHQPGLELFASPWSPPVWMKTKKAYNYGTLRQEDAVLRAYAKYFVKFVQAYAAEGANVTQIHVQNEPMADQKFPSCKWTGEEMRDFVKNYLGPEFEAQGMDTELWLGTINGPFFDFMMPGSAPFGEFYDQWANTVLSDPDAFRYLAGVGLQWGGKHIIDPLTASYPDKRIMHTESECGDGQNTWQHMEYVFRQMWIYLNHRSETYVYWNLALQDGGISTWGWSQNSLCTVDPQAKTMKLQPEFYLMKHFSHFAQPGAVVRATSGHFAGNTIAFENPDGSIVLAVGNNMHQARTFSFVMDGECFTAEVPAHSVNTFYIR